MTVSGCYDSPFIGYIWWNFALMVYYEIILMVHSKITLSSKYWAYGS